MQDSFNNIVDSNSDYGINIYSSSSSSLTNNVISNNSNYGVYIWNGENNLIYHNNFIDNNAGGVQAKDDGTNNRWNDSSEGNYWDDWTTPDVAPPFGIVDNPYVLDGSAGSQDYYPLTDELEIPIPEFSYFVIPMIGILFVIMIFKRKKEEIVV